MRSPVFLELTFVIDEASEMPKLVTIDPTPSLSGHKKYRVAGCEVKEVDEESKEKVNEYAFPIASGVSLAPRGCSRLMLSKTTYSSARDAMMR